MKKSILSIVALFFITCIHAQDFPGVAVDLLLNKSITVIEKPENLQKYGYDGFYTVPDFYTSNKDKNKLKYACCENYNSKYEALVGKTFKVDEINEFTNIIGAKKNILTISNEDTGVLYFEYDPKYANSFPFKVQGGLEYPDGYLCQDIKEEKDKFTGEIRYSSPASDGVTFMRVKKENTDITFMYIVETGSTANIGSKGLILLFEDGSKIEKPDANIKVEVGDRGGYIYSAFVELSSDDISKLTTLELTDNRLYIYDGTINTGRILKEYLKCIIEK